MRTLFSALVLLLCCRLSGQPSGPDLTAISFPNSGAPAAQHEFQLGVFQLHNFEYGDAARHFRAAEKADPHFALAYWGEAMTFNHAVWHEQDQPAALAVLARLAPTPEARQATVSTPREKLYLQAVDILYGTGSKSQRDQAYQDAMADLHRQFPADLEATTLYALSILGSAEEGRDFAIYMRAAAVLEAVFPQNPRHPGVLHYLIHCYDDPIHAPLGLRAARLYANVAPEASHAQHMVSHIFLALGMWEPVITANEKAIAVATQQRKLASRPAPTCGHAITWLEYAYLQVGRVPEARRLLNDCRRSAEVEATPSSFIDPDQSDVGTYAAMRSIFLVETQLWTDPVVAQPLRTASSPFATFTFDFATALAAFESSSPSAPAVLTALRADRERCLIALAADKETSPGEIEEERTRETILLGQIEALTLLRLGNSEAAVAKLRALAVEEHAIPLEFGPPLIDKPTQELLGETLLQLHRPGEARAAFAAALEGYPGRLRSAAPLASLPKPSAP